MLATRVESRETTFGISMSLSLLVMVRDWRDADTSSEPGCSRDQKQPCPDDDGPVARATRSPAGARRSTVMAAATTAIARRSMTPMTRRIAIRPAQQ